MNPLTFRDLKKNLKKEVDNLPCVNVAIIGDASTQFLNIALRGYGIEKQVNFQVYEAEYDMMDQEILNPTSSLYQSAPDIVILAPSTEKLLYGFQKKETDRDQLADNTIEKFRNYYQVIEEQLKCKVLLFNFPWINDSVFGHYAAKVQGSFPYQLRKLNYELMKLAAENGNLFLFDIDALQSAHGSKYRFEPKFFVNGKMVLSMDILPIVAKELTDIILSIKGTNLNKCLILDLDNTTWGGVIGDDGMEGIQIGSLGVGRAFNDLQLWAKDLKRRGVILCVCSKNTDSIAREPFEKHPEMILRLEDISVFVANWENKADNIRHIKEVLNIGYDSMVFLDDNPFERNLVRQELPAVTVPEMPKDPAEYISFLRNCNLFETASYSGEDNNRTKRYQEEAKRMSVKKSFKSIDTYLESLEMVADSGKIDSFSVPRVAQLTQRSNQFNLRTIRYTEGDIKRIMNSDSHVTMKIGLNDKYGAYGLISVLIGEIRESSLFIDTWIMSCRVLKRDVEKYVLNELAEECKKLQLTQIIGERIPTPKNVIVEDHYKNLGFVEKDGLWYLELDKFAALKCFISKS